MQVNTTPAVTNIFVCQIAKQGELESSIDSFERALDYAKLQEDTDAEKAIKKAMKDVNEQITKKLNDPGNALSSFFKE